MRMYRGGELVDKGAYWSPMDGQQIVAKGPVVLPGSHDAFYLRIPRGGLLVVAPLFGLMYVFFLPLFGVGTILVVWLAVIVSTATAVALTAIKVCSSVVSRSVSFGWTPSSQYLAGKKRKLRKPEDASNGSDHEAI